MDAEDSRSKGSMKLREANRLGARKYFEDKGVYRNPFPCTSAEFNEFERGWMQALKRDNARMVDVDRPIDADS